MGAAHDLTVSGGSVGHVNEGHQVSESGMSLNPIRFTEQVVGDFLRYQLTAYPFADENLHAQMRRLLSLAETRKSPLVRGPYISLSRAYATGGQVNRLVEEGLLHPHMLNLVPFPSLYGHQEAAIRSITAGRTTLVSTGTGSGKTECFLYPVISRCLQLRDEGAPPGIVAVFVYPMNALAEDQLGRLRELLAGTGIPFGMYVGRTPDRKAEVTGERLRAGASAADYRAALEKARREKRSTAVHPAEERASREEMRTPGLQPRILLTNVKQLELLLTRQADVHLFDGARLHYLVFDEAHTYGGVEGAETACLIRRLTAFCGREASQTVCIGTSATLADPRRGTEAPKEFAARFFGANPSDVEVVSEQYREDDWAAERAWPSPPKDEAAAHLSSILAAVGADDESGEQVANAWEKFAGESLSREDWPGHLYSALAGNELCFQIVAAVERPMALSQLAEHMSKTAGRTISEEEVLCWLVLGSASRREGRPLLRPVAHAFVRGVGGAVVSFTPGSDSPVLHLSVTADGAGAPADRQVFLPVTTCSTCGQHYFVHHVADIRVGSKGLDGGEAVAERRVWRSLDRTQGGKRVVLVDHLISSEDDEDPEEAPGRTHPVFLCASCGALHPATLDRCDACGRPGPLVRLYAVESGERNSGYLSSCLCCKAPGRDYAGLVREPARPVRAVNVSDVHVLAQNMIQQAERRRLLVFADNRQDAAFQAGWMRDHARRFRLRSLMMERIEQDPVSVGDLVAFLDRKLDGDDELSEALLPEVWNVARKQSAGVEHAGERKHFLRIAVLREIATGAKQRIGLEPWGRIQVEYLGLNSDLPFVKHWAGQLNVPADRLVDGIAALLDVQRRGFHLLDRDGRIFSRYWQDGDREIQRGYLPLLRGVPKGLKFERAAEDDRGRVAQWISARGDTTLRKAARAFGVDEDHVEDFLRELWELLSAELQLLAPVTLTGSKGRALPNCGGVRQIDADRLLIAPHRGRWRCSRCRRAQVRPTPNDRCLAWRCDGQLSFEAKDEENYDLIALDQRFAMLRPAEHSAQVPGDVRERLERQFKGTGEAVNTLVCTPTLEMGVDIGGLDTVLLRNVPPLPANYWQRVGRAGRRHRLAVNITYARDTSHDRAYFAEPLKLLHGRVEPPRFNLRNEVMVGKHVRAAVLTRLHHLTQTEGGLGEFDRTEIQDALKNALPPRVKEYLFNESGMVRTGPYDVSTLNTVVTKHAPDLVGSVTRTFRDRWPESDAEVVAAERLEACVLGMAAELERVITTLKKRLDWCLRQMSRLETVRSQKGALDPDEQALYDRCTVIVKRLKGVETRRRRDTEGYDDTNTYGVLAVEGFLPGYGLETGQIVGTAIMPRMIGTLDDFDLPRPPATALREYVPGNLLYANGHRFVPRYFHLEATEPLLFEVDTAKGAVREVGRPSEGALAALGAIGLKAVPICDCDLAHQSRITDEEEHRFQLPVAVYGEELERHGPGQAYMWGARELLFRRNLLMRLVNVGPASRMQQGTLGYPVSLLSGQCRSPFSSDRELQEFSKNQQDRYGKPVDHVGFFAEVTADALTLQGCTGREEAFSVLETLRIGMAQVLEMEREDLELLVVAHAGTEEVDGFLYDPMPGGSGLLEQACARWPEVVEAALEAVDGCPSACGRSCVDCLQTFRNAFFHQHLNRKLAAERLKSWGNELAPAHPIPPRMQADAPKGTAQPVNEGEERLRQMMLRAGLPAFEWQHQIHLGQPLGSTTPDAYFPGDSDTPSVCVYLDGLSGKLHGNPETAARDRAIREELRARGYEVIAIPHSDLDDREAMASHFSRIVRWLVGKEEAQRVRSDAQWFEDGHS